MKNEITRLHNLGFSILLLHPNSKRPIDHGWTKGPRKPLIEILRQYKNGMNFGVRLGSSSLVGHGYLHVIDCDVKSENPKHREEMENTLENLIPGFRSAAPRVESGRGNGSGHIYGLLKSSLRGQKLAQSKDKVKVKMPSANKPSTEDVAAFSQKELAAGWRLRPAWEIGFMGEGQQVVLPPSIHPDTGNAYKWVSKLTLEKLKDFPDIMPHVKNEPKHITINEAAFFKPVIVDLVGSILSDEIVNLIISGEGCTDRSASLLKASNAMIKAGFSRNEILSVLTDTENFLGQAAYDHRKTSSRDNAVDWLLKHTLKKSESVHLPENVFSSEVDRSVLPEAEAKKQIEKIVTKKEWHEKLERTEQGKLKSSLKNCMSIVSNVVGKDTFKFNEFSGRDIYGCDAPWGGVKGEAVKDIDALMIKVWFSENYNIEPTVNLMHELISSLAKKNGFHPVREYLNSLEWDGVERIDTWLKNYLGATGPEPYLSAVSRKVLCAMVARIFIPGIKFDHILILEGIQGIGKSSAGAILATNKWFLDALPNIRDKDSLLALQGTWLVEIAELKVLKSADSESYKAFFTSANDKVRAPYGQRWEEWPRQCVFIGTTNTDDYLKDKTGNRRFWPVKVHQCDFKALARDRDQLMAEALLVWGSLGEKLYLEDEVKAQAEEIQASRVLIDEEDMMEDSLLAFLAEEANRPESERITATKFAVSQLFGMGPFSSYKESARNYQFAGRVLKNNGFEKVSVKGRKFWRLSLRRGT